MVGAFFVLDASSRFLMSSSHLEELLGSPGPPLAGLCLWDACRALRGTAFEHQLGRVQRERERIDFEWQFAPEGPRYLVTALPTADGVAVALAPALPRPELHAAVLNRIDDAVIALDLGGRVVYFNRAAERMYGVREADVLGQPLSAIYEYRWLSPEHELEATRALAQSGTWRGENLHVRRDGAALHVDSAVSVMKDPSGAPNGLLAVVRDVTPQKHAEETLRISEARFRALASHAPVGIFMTDAGGDCVFVNDYWCAVAGLTPAQASGPGWTRALHPEDRERVAREWYAAVQARRPFSSEYRFLRPDGRVSWLQGSAVELRSESDELICHIGTLHDVTLRKLSETALRESEERLRALADNIPCLAWTADRLGWATWYNQRWYDYTGTTLEEMQGRGWEKVQHPDHLERVTRKVQHCLEHQLAWEDTFPLLGKDGQYRWFLSQAVPIRDASGAVTQWFGTNTDITERLQMEEALLEADRKKDEFLATLAHELRNPLAPLRNGLEVLKAAPGDRELSARVHRMMDRQLGQMVRLVDDLLDLSRITHGTMQLTRQRVDLADVLNAAIETSRPSIEERGHELRFVPNAQPSCVEADVTRLAQVFSNLLNNAAKYTKPGGHIELSVAHENGQVVVRVRDDGEGIPTENLERVFEMFTKGGEPSEGTQGGLGIGLSIVDRLVRMHGGTVNAHSAGPGKGSEFVVRLPSAPAIENVAAAPAVVPTPAQTPRQRILVADDNVDSAETLAMLLQLSNGDVRTAANGLEALELADQFRPDVVLLDIGMPGLDGYQTCRRIRAEAWGRDMLVIAMTGWGKDEDIRRSRSAGFDEHLVKPVDTARLESLLAAFRQHRERRSPPPDAPAGVADPGSVP
jgi:PAS domain S-box-containing protein